MIEIFIPVLWICMNNNCEFMAPDAHFLSEKACRQSIDDQKEHMKTLAKQAKTTITVLEGTCVQTRVDDPKGNT